jgi:DNA-binding NtrC family response regulator
MHQCALIVVEDEALLRTLMEMTLEVTDYDFRILSTAGAALEALEAEAKSLEVLVTDINLGDATLTGFDLARRARELNPDILVIYVSGAAGHLFEQEKVPGSFFLAKPIDTDRLLSLLRRYCEPDAEPPTP